MKLKTLLLAVMISITSPIIFTNCTPAKYSQTVVDATKEAWNKTDELYDKIASSSDKSFKNFEDDYLIVSTNIGLIYENDLKRKHNSSILSIISDVEKRFDKYKAEHQQAGTVNNAMVSIYKRNMDGLWRKYYNAENNLNK